MEKNLKKFKLTFWVKKSTNIVLEYTKRCEIATFGGGGMFSKKSSFSLYFHEILDFWDFNGAICMQEYLYYSGSGTRWLPPLWPYDDSRERLAALGCSNKSFMVCGAMCIPICLPLPTIAIQFLIWYFRMWQLSSLLVVHMEVQGARVEAGSTEPEEGLTVLYKLYQIF